MSDGGRLDRLADVWWRRLPRALAHLSPYLQAVAADGLYLAVWRRAAALATPACLLLGALIGATHWGYGEIWTFAESRWLLGVMVALGMTSAHLGAAFLIGYAAGDYLLLSGAVNAGNDAKSSVLALLSHVVQYGVMASVLVTIPILSKYLAADLATRFTRQAGRRLIIAMIGQPVMAMTLVFFWMCALPQLIRPPYLWAGAYSMPTAPVTPVQSQTNGLINLLFGEYDGAWPWLLTVVLVVLLIKMAIQSAILMDAGLKERYDRVLADAQVAAAPWTNTRNARAMQAVTRAAWVTLMLAGLYDPMTYWQPALIFLVTLTLGALRVIPLQFTPARVSALIARVPVFVRFVLVSALMYPVAALLMSGEVLGSSFTPLVIVACVGVVLFHLATPARPDRDAAAPPLASAAQVEG